MTATLAGSARKTGDLRRQSLYDACTMSDKRATGTPSTVPVATDQVGIIPTAPKSVSSPNSTRNALLLAFSRI
jgi:hypothetical protein